jgi:hypothetical protein
MISVYTEVQATSPDEARRLAFAREGASVRGNPRKMWTADEVYGEIQDGDDVEVIEIPEPSTFRIGK